MTYDPRSANQMTLWRARDGVFVLDWRESFDDAKGDAKEHGWKVKDIEKMRIKNVRAALLHLLNN